MSKRVCPWWLGYLLTSPLRRLFENPERILAPCIREGMTVLEPGPGMGFFTLELARRVGPAGRVIAVDIQPRMLAGLRRRAGKAGLLERIDLRLAQPESLAISDLAGMVDFVLAFAVVHEMLSPAHFFIETYRCLKPNGCLLLAEPSGHVKDVEFADELTAAAEAGFRGVERPVIRRFHSASLQKA